MLKFILLVFFFLGFTSQKVLKSKHLRQSEDDQNIVKTIQKFFSSDAVKNIQEAWKDLNTSYQSKLQMALRESQRGVDPSLQLVGTDSHKTLKAEGQAKLLAKGYFFNDNIASVMLDGLQLREIPDLLLPLVTVSFGENLVQVRSKLSKLFLDAKYRLSRSNSSISLEPLDPQQNSPFSLKQVDTTGVVTIIGDECWLSGYAVTRLEEQLPQVGLSLFEVARCKFSIEISNNPNDKLPPVIADYFSDEESKNLERQISVPLSMDLKTKLETAIISKFSRGEVSKKKIYDFSSKQQNVFKKFNNYMNIIERKLNKQIIDQNNGAVELEDWKFKWMDSDGHQEILISGVKMSGLDHAYTSHRGGPVKDINAKIIEELRFNRLVVRGSLAIRSTKNTNIEFSVELLEIPVAFIIDINDKGNKILEKFNVGKWMHFSFFIMTPFDEDRVRIENLVYAYLDKRVPATIEKYLREPFRNLVEEQAAHKPDVSYEVLETTCIPVKTTRYN